MLLICRFNMHHSAPIPAPMAVGSTIFKNDSDSFSYPSTYKSVIGALQYVTQTRPDINYSVNKLSQFLQAPSLKHWQVVKRIFIYLQGTKTMVFHSNHALRYNSMGSQMLIGHVMLKIENQLVLIVCVMEILSSTGLQKKNSKQYLDPLQSQNTEPWMTWLLNSSGFVRF